MNLNASETGIDAGGDLSRAGANNQSSGDLNPAVDGWFESSVDCFSGIHDGITGCLIGQGVNSCHVDWCFDSVAMIRPRFER